MSENHPNTPQNADACSLDYPNPAAAATSSCAAIREKIHAELMKQGFISFPDFLGIALYDPKDGYYASGSGQVGRDGDFYTSVSVGPLFGQLLARRFLNWWKQNHKPTSWRILEIGAHDGKLAADILQTLANLEPEAWEGLEYAIVEPLPVLRKAQEERLAPLASKLNLACDFQTLSNHPLPGIAFGNEILDALPFHLIRFNDGEWRELFVSDQWEFVAKPIAPSSSLGHKTARLGNGFPENYQTEVRTNFREFLSQISSCIGDGMLLFVDYGFAAPEYYDTHRTSGTLRTFSKHKAAEDPLDSPGMRDITAHVDFTDLAREAETLNWHPTHFSNQGSYLTHLAAEMIKDGELNDPKTIAQFRSLTHPAHLGASFHVVEFEKSKQPTPQVMHRLALGKRS